MNFKWDHQVDEELTMITITLRMLYVMNCKSFIVVRKRKNSDVKSVGAPRAQTGLRGVIFCPMLGIKHFKISKSSNFLSHYEQLVGTWKITNIQLEIFRVLNQFSFRQLYHASQQSVLKLMLKSILIYITHIYSGVIISAEHL